MVTVAGISPADSAAYKLWKKIMDDMYQASLEASQASTEFSVVGVMFETLESVNAVSRFD